MATSKKSPSEVPGRNDPCPCGSGKKFKRCCEGKRATTDTGRRRKWLGLALVVVVGLGVTALIIVSNWVNADATPAAETGRAPVPWAYDAENDRYWHPGHQHWHAGPPPDRPEPASSSEPASSEPAPEDWEYDVQNDRYWHPGHNHWHSGSPPPEELRQTPSSDPSPAPPVPENSTPAQDAGDPQGANAEED